MLLALASLAYADSITLDTGATIEGDLARYELGGDCQVSVTEGELAGVIVIVPCHRVASFVRTSIRTPVPIGLAEEVAKRSRVEDPYAAVKEEPAVAEAAPTVELPPARTVAGEPLYDEPLFPSSPTEPILPSQVVDAPAAGTPVDAAEAVEESVEPAAVEPESGPEAATGPMRAPMMGYIDEPAEEDGAVHHAVRF